MPDDFLDAETEIIRSLRERTKDDVEVRLRGGPGDGQMFYLMEPPSFITYGAAAGRYVRVPTDGVVVEYRFARYD